MSLRRRELFGKEGGLFFVTTSFHKQRSLLLDDRYYRIILGSLAFLRQKYKFDVIAYVVMSTHLHLILFIWKGTTLSDIMRDFKKFTAYKIRRQLEEDGAFDLLDSLRVASDSCQEVTPDTTNSVTPDTTKVPSGVTSRRKEQTPDTTRVPSGVTSRRKVQKFKIWEDRFDDLYITQERTFWTKFNYIHNNPIKAGLVEKPEDYPYSSAKNYYLGTKGGLLKIDIDFVSG